VRNQSYRPIEIIVVNDGSDDDTEAIAARYGDSIQYLSQANAGPSAARNRGIQHSRGQYIQFLDGDDLLAPESIEKLVAAMEERDDRLVIMGHACCDAAGEPIGVPFVPQGGDTALLPPLFSRNLAPIHCYLAPRRMVVAAGGFDEQLWQCEDWDLWIRLALRGARGTSIPFAGARYRRYPGSLSSNKRRLMEGCIEVMIRTQRRILDCPELSAWIPDLAEAGRESLGDVFYSGYSVTRLNDVYRGVCELAARLAPGHTWAAMAEPTSARWIQSYFDYGYFSARQAHVLLALSAYRQALRWGAPRSRTVVGILKVVPHAVRYQFGQMFSKLPGAGRSPTMC
jgi:glycosyltransferase involved in cell wall biosynthesis